MRFFQRSIKYFLSLCITYVVILYVLSFTEMMVLTRGQTFHTIFSTTRGMIMLIAVIALSLAYPYFGFMRKSLKGNVVRHKDIIIRAFEMQRFRLFQEEEGYRLTFVADNLFKRLGMLFEDHVLVTQQDDMIEIRGNRRAVAYVSYRLEGALERAREIELEQLKPIMEEDSLDTSI